MSSEFENKEKRFEIAKMILEAYKTSNFEILYDLFANDIKWCSQWVVPDREGKDVVTKYYDKKKKL